MENIYANAGKVISGERYVTRGGIEEKIKNRVLAGQATGSFSIMGMQRTGKSSILANIFVKNSSALLQKRRIVVDISLSSINKPENLFTEIVGRSFGKIRRREAAEDLKYLEESYEEAMAWNLERGSMRELQDYMEELAALDYHVIAVVDEFDNAISLFEKYPQCFNYMRELAYKEEYHLDFVIASRRMLTEICKLAVKGVSPFPNIFENCFVGPYGEAELARYFEIFQDTYGIALTEKEKKSILKYTGGLAYWMDVLMKAYVDRMLAGEKNISIEQIYEENMYTFLTLYDKLKDLLEDQELLAPLMQLTFGPVQTATREDINILCGYGIFVPAGPDREKRKIFSESFRDYLFMLQESVEFAPLWNKTERGMRSVFTRMMFKKYWKNWLRELKNKYGEQESLKFAESERRLGNLRRMMQAGRQTTEVTLIDMLDTRVLFRLFEKEWDVMQVVFPDLDRERWKELGGRVSSARNEFQHNNSHNLSRDVIAQNNADMQFILERIEKWNEKHPVSA